MTIRTSLGLVLLCVAASAQEVPFRTPLFGAGYVFGAVSGDVNGDGAADLVTNNNETVRVLLQISPGVFAAPVDQAEVDLIGRMALADFDHDGDPDLAAAVNKGGLSADDFVAVLQNTGGGFGPPELLITEQDPSDVAVGDFDQDGHADLALPCPASSFAGTGTRVSLFFGVGDGSFQPKVDALGGVGPRSLEVADVDSDGDLDMVVINHLGTLRTMAGDGAGGFALLAGAELGSFSSDLSVGDLDADGDADALITYEDSKFRMALGLGDGSWLPQAHVALPTQSRRGVLADVDEDGDDDVVTLLSPPTDTSFAHGFVVALSHGDGSFAAVQRYGAAHLPRELVVADLTQDGDLDLFGGMGLSFSAASAVLLPGDGQGGFGVTLRTGNYPAEATLADFDLDGQPDLVVACPQGPHVALHAGLGHGAYGAAQLLDFANTPAALAAADFVEDGLPDILAINGNNPGGLTVRAGDGAFGFGAALHFALSVVPWGMGSGDPNLDGHLDVVVACNGGSARVMLGDGAGGFTLSATVPTASISPDAAAFGDLDANGLPDLVATTTGAFGVTVALGEGGGAFSAPTQVPITNHNQHDVALGDLDGDDDLDIISSGGFVGALNVLVNNGRAGFTTGPTLSAPDNWGVEIADVDADGLADVLAGAESLLGSSKFGAVHVWRGLGAGAFAAPLTIPAPRKTQELLLADLDGDGARDVAALAVEHDEIWMLASRHGPWAALGQGLAGVQGVPRQQGFGTLAAGKPFEFLLTDARPAGSSWHVIGLSTIDAPFKGGTLVPTPLLITGPWPLDGAGELSIAGGWPGAPASGVPLWFQFVQADPAAPKGWSMSTAIKATLP